MLTFKIGYLTVSAGCGWVEDVVHSCGRYTAAIWNVISSSSWVQLFPDMLT